MREVLVTGVGLSTPLGNDLEGFARQLMAGRGGWTRLPRTAGQDLAVARVTEDLDLGLHRNQAALLDRHAKLALKAAARALQHAHWADDRHRLSDAAVFVGNGSGPTHAVNDSYQALHDTGRLPGLTLLRCLPGAAAGALAMHLGLGGGAHTYSGACASASLAIGEALRAIRHGYLNCVLAGGAEAPLGEGTLRAWEALRVLAPCGSDPAGACRPFDLDRRGLVLAEGAAFFVLESADHARARGVPGLARMAGYGTSADAHHWTEPLADGQIRAMTAALTDAHLCPADISAVNAHGTGTPVGDRVEAQALSTLFAQSGPPLPVSSTKAAHGHLLGASGAVELAAALVTLRTGQVPPTRNLQTPDVPAGLDWVRGAPGAVRSGGRAVLSNSFAFGGTNACLILTPPTP